MKQARQSASAASTSAGSRSWPLRIKEIILALISLEFTSSLSGKWHVILRELMLRESVNEG